jgi:hypothetical protein
MNHVMRRTTVMLLGLGALVVAACGGDSNGDPGPNDPGAERPPAELNILNLAQDAPPLYQSTVTFWAVRGQDREGRIYFQDSQGGQGEEYMRLRVEAGSLLSRPDGTPIAVGDSVEITLSVVDPQQTLFQLAPEGLKFSTQLPAELKIRYGQCGDDLNDDGRVDESDAEVQAELGIWRQATLADPFVRLGTLKVEDLREVEAELTSFSRYAIAY